MIEEYKILKNADDFYICSQADSDAFREALINGGEFPKSVERVYFDTLRGKPLDRNIKIEFPIAKRDLRIDCELDESENITKVHLRGDLAGKETEISEKEFRNSYIPNPVVWQQSMSGGVTYTNQEISESE